MHPQLKAVSRGAAAWRLFAVATSASALTLALWAKPGKSLPVSGYAAAREAEAPTDAIPATTPFESKLNALRDSGDADALESLLAIAEQGDAKLLSATLDSIAQIGGDRAREFLVRRFYAAAEADLPQLAAALATLGDAQARAILKQAAHSPRPGVRSAAFDALSTLDSADVREFMLQALGFADPSPAAGYFLNCREPRALPALERLARSDSSAQRRVAIDALFAQGASAEDAIFRLLREDDDLLDSMLEGQPPTLTARQALRRASIARLRAGAVTSGWVFQFLQGDLSGEAREALVQAARDPGSRESALNALSVRGDVESLRALSTLAQDSDRGLAERAGCNLLSRPDSRWRPFLQRSTRPTLADQTATALQRINAAEGSSQARLSAPARPARSRG